jgi:hypothetical protein
VDEFQWEVDAELVAQIKPITDLLKAISDENERKWALAQEAA